MFIGFIESAAEKFPDVETEEFVDSSRKINPYPCVRYDQR